MAGAKQVARHAGTHTTKTDESNFHNSKDNRTGPETAREVPTLSPPFATAVS
jgi:hypothetical protein